MTIQTRTATKHPHSGGTVQSAERVLYILQLLNQENGVTANHMAMTTQISRPATYRMLETLRTLGFISKDKLGRYWLEPQTLSLSSGYRNDIDLSARMSAILRDISEQVPWPLSVSTRSGNAMLIRASTDLESAAAARRRLAAGWAMPGLLNSAGGNIVLAHTDRPERDKLLDMALATHNPDTVASVAEREAIHERLDRARLCGYVVVTHSVTWNWIDRTSALGVPIKIGERLYGALSARYFRAKIKDADAIDQYLGPLRDAARRLSETIG